KLMSGLEEHIETLERRGINLATFLGKLTDSGLPPFRVVIGGNEQWCYTQEHVDELRTRERERLGHDLVVEEEQVPGTGNGQPQQASDAFFVQELHEVKAINRGLEELRRFGLDVKDLVPPERVAGREPPLRLRLESGESGKVLATLRDLVMEVRRLGEK